MDTPFYCVIALTQAFLLTSRAEQPASWISPLTVSLPLLYLRPNKIEFAKANSSLLALQCILFQRMPKHWDSSAFWTLNVILETLCSLTSRLNPLAPLYPSEPSIPRLLKPALSPLPSMTTTTLILHLVSLMGHPITAQYHCTQTLILSFLFSLDCYFVNPSPCHSPT